MVVITLPIALVALLSPLVSAITAHGPSACPSWCQENFVNDSDCLIPSQNSTGPCFECGPASYDPNTALCNGICANLATDDDHCGGCSIQVGEGNSCCNGMPVNLLTSKTACGHCGILVPDDQVCCNGTPSNPADCV